MLFVSCQVAEVLLLGCCVIKRLHYHYSKSVNRPTHAQTNRNYTWNRIVIGNSSRKVSQKMVQDKMASKFTAKASNELWCWGARWVFSASIGYYW